MAEVRFTVRGAHRSFHPAERGTVHARVSVEGPQAKGVYDGAARSADAVVASINELHDPPEGPVTWWASDALRTWAQRPWNQDGKQLPLVQHAQVDFRVKFQDFAALSAWLGQAVGVTGFVVDRIAWTLTEVRSKTLTDASRVTAVHAAREKAQAYADALDLGPVRCAEIADAGMLGTGRPEQVEAAMYSRMAGGAPEVTFAPEDIEIVTEVDAVFLAG